MYKKLFLAVIVGSLAVVSTVSASAPFLNGTMSASEFGVNGSTFTNDSFTLDSMNNVITKSKTLDFVTYVPAKSDLTTYSLTLSGIGTSPTTENIPNFFIWSTPDPDIVGSTGTTPNNRFSFDLTSIQYAGNGLFLGSGAIFDSGGTFADTSGNLTISFSSPAGAPLDQGSYSLTITANGTAAPLVPEPATYSIFGLSMLGLWAFHRRKASVRL